MYFLGEPGFMSDGEAARSGRRPRDLGAYSDAEITNNDKLNAPVPNRSLEQAAMETLQSGLKDQPKITPRRVQPDDKPINYVRGAYRPQPVHWRGAQGTGTNMSGSYNDSQLVSQLWMERNKSMTGSEAEADVEDMELESPTEKTHVSPRRMPPGHRSTSSIMSTGSSERGSAFEPVSPGSQKRVKIVDQRQPPSRRRGGRRPRRDLPPGTMEPGPVDFNNYGMTAQLWMEQVDQQTVKKSKTMAVAVMPEGQSPPESLARSFPKNANTSSDDVFLPPQWVIARGRSIRKRKRQIEKDNRNSTVSATSEAESDLDTSQGDRPMSPNSRQMLLFFRVGSNWKDLAWVLFDGIQSDAETMRMIQDIQMKHPGELTDQVHDMMHRWWKRKGSTATIEELQKGLQMVKLVYVREENLDPRLSTASFTDTEGEDDLNISEVSDTDPEVTRLINEFQTRSHNNSAEWDSAPEGSINADILRKLKKKSLDRSRYSSSQSIGRSNRGSSRYASSHESLDYGSDGEAFYIVQPQLRSVDVSIIIPVNTKYL